MYIYIYNDKLGFSTYFRNATCNNNTNSKANVQPVDDLGSFTFTRSVGGTSFRSPDTRWPASHRKMKKQWI